MANVGTSDPEDDVGGDVGGMVGDAFQAAGDHEAIHGLLGELGFLLDELEQVGVGAAIHAVDLVVHIADGVSKPCIPLKQGVNGGSDHAAGVFAHGREVDRQIDFASFNDVACAAGNPHGLIADAFEVAIDLDDGEDEAEVNGHGLLFGEEFVGHLVELTLGGVDCGLILLDVLAEGEIALEISFDRGLDGLLREGSHGKEFVLELGKLQLEVNTRHSVCYSST